VLKGLATILTYLTGIPGGIFAPTIATGTSVGHFVYWAILQGIDKSVTRPKVCLLGATAYFAGVTQSPITAFSIMLGMIDSRGSYVPAMLICSVLGWLSAQLVSPRALYPALAESRIPPLPPESCQKELKALPPPQYISKKDIERQADFIEVSMTLPRITHV